MLKSQFIDLLRGQVTAAADAELGPVYSAIGCPYIDQYFSRYATRPAAEGEALLRRFAPATRGARTAQDMIGHVVVRVHEGVRHWRETGQPPPEIAAAEPAAPAGSAPPVAHALRAPDGRETLASLEADLGPGQPLDAGTAARMSGALGTDVGGARIHAGPVAARKAADAGAVAFAVGPNVILGAGAPAAGTLAGDALLAHELAHTLQQRSAAGDAEARRRPIGDESSAAEDHADTAAAGALVELHGEAQPGLLARLGGAARKLANRVSDLFQSDLRLQRCDLFQDPVVDRSGVVHGNAVARTGEHFEPGNVPGERPTATLRDGVHEFRFDGDGDQMKELSCRIRVSQRWPGGSARRLHVELTQISSSQVQTADYELPDGSPDPFVTISDVTDGQSPTVVSLHGPLLRFHPPAHDNPQQLTYRGEFVPGEATTAPAVSQQSHTFTFPAEAAPGRQVFQADAARQVGGIWSDDLSVGAYRDRFRITLEKPDAAQPTTHFGISILDGMNGEPTAGDRVDLQVTGPLRPQIVPRDNVRFAIDINGDGQPDLELFDHLTAPESSGRSDPSRERHHDIRLSGTSLRGTRELRYTVDEFNWISAGSTRPRAEDRTAASNATAVTGLTNQQQMGVEGLTRPEQRGGMQAELDVLDTILARARQRATQTNPPLIGQRVFDTWNALARDFTVIEAQRRGTGVSTGQQSDAATHAEAFYTAMREETRSAERTISAGGMAATTNEYTDGGMAINVDAGGYGSHLAGEIRAGRWDDATRDYRLLVNGLDRWISFRHAHQAIAMAGSPENATLGQIGAITQLRSGIEEVRGHNPTRIAAVFHPDQQYMESGRITEVPLSLYAWKEGNTFHLRDVTDSDGPHETMDAPDATTVPAALFHELADSSHYPRGVLHYQVPGGAGGQEPTSGPGRWREALSWIGLGLGVIGLGLATFATGGLAAVGAYALAGSALAGGVVAATDLLERVRHGNLSATTAVVDSAQIVAAIAGLGALRSAGIVNAAREAGAASEPLTGAAALTAQWHNRAVVALTAVGATADAVQLAVFLPEAAAQYDAIGASQADEETKRRQRIVLLGQLALTAGMTVLSVRGAVGEFTPGRGIRIVYENGVPVAVPQGMSIAGTRIQSRRPGITADTTEASFRTAEADHVGRIRSEISGPTGETLAGVEDLARHTAWRSEEARRILQPILDGAGPAAAADATLREQLRRLVDDVQTTLGNPARSAAERQAAVQQRLQAFQTAHPGLAGVDFAAAIRRVGALGNEGVAGVMLADPAGHLTLNGQPAGTLDELILRVNQANNAARSHGLPTEYSVEVIPGQDPTAPQRVQVRSRESGPVDAAAAAPMLTQAGPRSAEQGAQVARVRRIAPGSTVEVMASGRIRIDRIEISIEQLSHLTDATMPRFLAMDGPTFAKFADVPGAALQRYGALTRNFDVFAGSSKQTLDRFATLSDDAFARYAGLNNPTAAIFDKLGAVGTAELENLARVTNPQSFNVLVRFVGDTELGRLGALRPAELDALLPRLGVNNWQRFQRLGAAEPADIRALAGIGDDNFLRRFADLQPAELQGFGGLTTAELGAFATVTPEGLARFGQLNNPTALRRFATRPPGEVAKFGSLSSDALAGWAQVQDTTLAHFRNFEAATLEHFGAAGAAALDSLAPRLTPQMLEQLRFVDGAGIRRFANLPPGELAKFEGIDGAGLRRLAALPPGDLEALSSTATHEQIATAAGDDAAGRLGARGRAAALDRRTAANAAAPDTGHGFAAHGAQTAVVDPTSGVAPVELRLREGRRPGPGGHVDNPLQTKVGAFASDAAQADAAAAGDAEIARRLAAGPVPNHIDLDVPISAGYSYYINGGARVVDATAPAGMRVTGGTLARTQCDLVRIGYEAVRIPPTSIADFRIVTMFPYIPPL